MEIWARYGFESLEDYLEEIEAGWDRIGWSQTHRSRKDLPEPRLPESHAPERLQRAGTRSCQVNIKLTPRDHDSLERAARAYGVRPATMAQLLVNRGICAVLDLD